MSLKNKVFNMVVSPITKILSIPVRINSEILKRINPIKKVSTKYGPILLNVNNPKLYYRATSFFTKEPDTLAWIDTFEEDDIFYDIGANVGLYSLYAATKGVRSIAFEPESQNYAELNRNIHNNGLNDFISAYCLACSNDNNLDSLFLSSFGTGQALHNFGEEKDYNGMKTTSVYKQASFSYSLDELIRKYNLEPPTHIKIDVDGIESKVIEGAKSTLKSDTTRTVLIEINGNCKNDRRIVNLLSEYGYVMISRYHSPIYDNSEFSSIYNYIFSRDKISLEFQV